MGASPEEDLLLQMQGMIAEYERAKILERSRRGKRHAARRGSVNVLSGAPYGYRYVAKQEAGREAYYQVVFEQACVVQQMFEWVGRDRVSLREVCRRLEQQAVPSPTGKSWWDRTTVWGLLKNPAYRGSAAFGKTRVGERRPQLRPQRSKPEHARRLGSTYDTPPEEQISIEVPALVSHELFVAVAEQLAENRRQSRQRARGARYLLQGLLECSCCGYAYYGKKVSRASTKGKVPYAYYRCVGTDAYRFGGARVCQNKQLRTDQLDSAVWTDVCALLQNPRAVQQEFERRLDRPPAEQSTLAQIRKQIATVQRNISRLIDAYEDGLLEKSEFEPRIQKAKARLHRFQQDAADAADRETQRQELRLVIGHLEAFADQVCQGLQHAEWDTRREIIRSLIKTVKIEDRNVRIIYRVSPRPFVEGPARGLILPHCGGVISPLLANIALNSVDWKLHELGYRFVRYADDFVVLCQSETQAREAHALVEQQLTQLGLTLSPEKTRITRFSRGFLFLGFHVTSWSVTMRDKSVEKFKTRIRELTTRSHNLDAKVVERVNQTVRGVANYFATPFSRVWMLFRELVAANAAAIDEVQMQGAFPQPATADKTPAADGLSLPERPEPPLHRADVLTPQPRH